MFFWILLWFGFWTPPSLGRGRSGWVAGWFAPWMSWENISAFGFPASEGSFIQEGGQLRALPLENVLFPRVVGAELVQSLESKEWKCFQWGEDNSPSAHGIEKTGCNFPPFTVAPYVVDLSGTVSIGSKYSRKERKSYSVRKACWILPLLWGQMIIWSQLGVSWSCVSLHQPRSCPLARPTSGLGNSSIYCETRQGFFILFYPVNPPLGQLVPAGRWRKRQCWVLAAKRVSR